MCMTNIYMRPFMCRMNTCETVMFMTNTYYTLFVYDERVRIPECA